MGTNMAGMICGMIEHGETPPDLILFADTGGEKPHTYAYLDVINPFLRSKNWPLVEVVRTMKGAAGGPKHWESLEDQCLRLAVLPSIVYGAKTCSLRYKVEPQDKYVESWAPAIEAWARGERVTKLIGYDIGEPHRYEEKQTETYCGKYRLRFPLVEYGWDRDECVAAIKRAGLPLPGKSACFFCPSSKKHEVVDLMNRYPELYERACQMERRAIGKDDGGLTKIEGLGRKWAWKNIADAPLFDYHGVEIPCECMD